LWGSGFKLRSLGDYKFEVWAIECLGFGAFWGSWFGLWALGFGLRVLGFGLLALKFGARGVCSLGFGLWALKLKLGA
jgi:hypothetical protein